MYLTQKKLFLSKKTTEKLVVMKIQVEFFFYK